MNTLEINEGQGYHTKDKQNTVGEGPKTTNGVRFAIMCISIILLGTFTTNKIDPKKIGDSYSQLQQAIKSTIDKTGAAICRSLQP